LGPYTCNHSLIRAVDWLRVSAIALVPADLSVDGRRSVAPCWRRRWSRWL